MYNFPDNERFRKLLRTYPAKAIQFLYEYYYHQLIRVSKRLTRDHKASEDIVQEAFFHIWRKHEWLGRHHEKPIGYYLVRVVENMSISSYQKERRNFERMKKYEQDQGLVAAEPSEEQKVISREIMEHIRKLIAEFPAREQQCYLWSREEDMTYKQIAERLNVSEKAVERSITSAKRRLRKHWLLMGKSV